MKRQRTSCVDVIRRNNLKNLAKITACACGTGALLSLQQALAADPQSGIRNLKGEVAVNGDPGGKGLLINPGSTVQTGENGEVVYVMGRNAYLQSSNTVVEHLTQGLRLITGRLLSVFGPARETLALQTPSVTIGIRGTGVYLNAQEKSTYFCLCYGTASVVPKNTSKKAFEASSTSHKAYDIFAHDSPTVSDAGMLGHTNAELIMLEALVGRTPAFKT